MATKVIMPKQGLQMTEGTITQWLVPEGGKCVEGEPLFEMETDKLTITMDAPATGTLLKIVHGADETVEITKLIGVIGEPGEDISAILAEDGGAAPAAPAAQEAAPAAPAAAPTEGTYDYDCAVIGGGPGGYEAAVLAGKLGLKTVLVEKRDLGGTCLNRGCIPTKALLHSAEVYNEAKNAASLGVNIEGVSFDYAKMAANKENVTKKLRNGIGGLLKACKVTVIKGEAKLTGKHSFVVDGKETTVKNIILATGSEPARIPIPGIDKPGVVNSDGVLASDKCPESVVIIGGGVIGIEFATLFNTLGKKVTVVEMLPKIMGPTDDEVSKLMMTVLKKRGVEFHLNAKVVSIEDGMKVVYEEDGKTCEAPGEQVVVAIGRRPVTKDLGFEAAGVKMTERGFVEIDDHCRTNVENIYAIGDITGKIQLAHVASAQGHCAVANCAGEDKTLNYNIVPSCIYTTPEIAQVGMTEKECKDKGLNIKVGNFNIAGNGRSMIMGENQGFAKVVTDARTGEIYGAAIMAPRATDMISEVSAVMKSEGTIEELADTIHPHPTVSEIIMEAAHDVEGRSCNKV